MSCEFRIGNVGDLNTKGVGELTVVATFQICEVKATGPGGDATHPKCELPDFSTEQCPIAQFQKGAMTLKETNVRLRTIFAERKNAQGSTKSR